MKSIAVLSQGTLSDAVCNSQLTQLEQDERLTVHRLPIAPRTPIDEVLQAAHALSGKQVEGVILPNIKPVDERFLDLIGPQLRLVSLPFVGTDGLVARAFKERNVKVANTAGVNAEETAEHAIALLYAMRRNLLALDTHVRSGNWSTSQQRPVVDIPLGQQSIAILGFGAVGQAILRQLATHRGSLLVLASERFFNGDVTEAQRQAIEQVTLIRNCLGLSAVAIAPSGELASRIAGINNLLVAASTKASAAPVIGTGELEKAQRGTAIVNIARASLIDEHALVEALGRGIQFATDVFAKEPVDPSDPIVKHVNNLISTPHVAGAGSAVQRKMFAQALRNLLIGIGLDSGHEVRSYVEL